ncbi:hypothetical protein JRQ81_017141 [Phrynocephalus forsythii]|uniref:Zinc finger protein 518A n=1 Tax=Phrynocephalus forsythii TaxID=171643 RepID=A0A9Q0XPS1_9SAUR|nr:hypothetical protein JRQ81_017141 [Phrynocephalus forsythii]
MPSEQEPSFCIQEASLLQENVSDRMCVPTSFAVEKSTLQVAGLKNVKIELPRVHIPNEVLFKHEIDKYMKLFRCKEKSAHAFSMQRDGNGPSLHISEIYAPHSKPGLHYEEGLKTSAKILNFSCTKCRNSIRYSPNDLQKHFQLLHHGELPSYPCEMCNFSANDFQAFNQHRRTHRSTLVKCEICNDDHTYTLLDLTKHFTSKHCVNGHFQCERCRFSTQDVGTFVQHIHRHNEMKYKCDKCHHVSFSEEDFKKHFASHTGTFPFSCQYCNYMASRKSYLLKHIITFHRDHLYAKHKMDIDNSEKKMKTSTGLKLILKRYKTGASRKALWRRKRITSSNYRIGEDRQVLKDPKDIKPSSEELDQSAKELQLNEHKIFLNEKQIYSGVKSSPSAEYNRTGLGSGLGLLKKAVYGPTVLMVKNNKISVPANYSAKFMGFKVVDGKQHIVIKLLPSDKQNLPVGNKADMVKDSSTDCLQQTADNFNLPSGATSHEINHQASKNNSVYSLMSPPGPFSTHHPGKIKQENFSSLSWNTSQSVAPPIVVVGNCSNHLPVKPSSSLSSDLVGKAGTGHVVSWTNDIPQEHPQVLSSAGTHMLHYDPMKKNFPPEFRVLNGEVNNSSKHNNLYCSSADISNQVPLPFHNYSKMDILEKSKNLLSSKTIPLQSRSVSESTACFSPTAGGLNLEKRTYGFIHTNNSPVFSANQPSYVLDRQHCMENQDGQRYLNTKINQVLERVTEISKQEKASSCVNPGMPKITSVFSLQGNQASSYLSPKVNQSLQVLKGQAIPQPHNYIKTNYNQSFPNNQTDFKTAAYLKNSAALCNLPHSSGKFRREMNVNYSATKEGVCFRDEGRVPTTTLKTEEIGSASKTVGIGTLLKTQADSIITQQLAKDKMRYGIHHSNATHPTVPEQKKPTLLQPSPPRFFVPFRLAAQPALQVISGTPSNMSSSDAQATRGAATSLLINQGPGMILTFGSGSLGTIANASENNPRVLEKFASKENGKGAVFSSEVEMKVDSCRSKRNSSGVNVCRASVSASSTGHIQKEQLNTINPESRISSMKILSGYQGSHVPSTESIKPPEIGQEPVYALLPDGRQAVFLKCMSPNKSLLQNHSISLSSADSQNTEPKKPGAMQQKLFLKFKTLPTADSCQSVNNLVSSLQFNSMHSLSRPVLHQEKTAVSSSNALLFPGRLIPANACSASDKSKEHCTSLESVHSSKHTKVWSQKNQSDSAQTVIANKVSSLSSQMSVETMTNKISKAKRHSRQTGAKVSDAAVSQKNKSLKRKSKEDLQEPPRKKTLHRKCKQKNQMDVNEFESLLPIPCRPRLSKDTRRILKLFPFNSKQLVKCPRRNQPVVVLNHPDADVPEVVNVMKTIAKFKGHVLKVSLSKRTIDALLEPAYYSDSLYIISSDISRRKRRMLKPVSPVKERFVLKLTLKKTSKNNYQIVKTTSDNTLKTKFSCWFCGRVFDNQDNWVGHGQRHLMEATRDWNSLG